MHPSLRIETVDPASLRIEAVDPASFADAASRILQVSWQPTCLLYTPAYLRWQSRFPRGPIARGVAAFDGGEPVGFAAVVPRRLRSGGHPVRAYVLSFVAVRPETRGRGIAAALYQALLDIVMAHEPNCPIVAFAELNSVGQRLLHNAFEAVGYGRQSLGIYRTYSGMAGPATADEAPMTWKAVRNPADFLTALGRCDDPQTLWIEPDQSQLEHYQEDPRGRVLALAQDRSGDLLGGAMITCPEIVTPRGVTTVPTIDSVFLPQSSPAGLVRDLVRFAAACWPDRLMSPTLIAPNLISIHPPTLRAAGLRATPSCFEGSLFLGKNHDPKLWTVEKTNLEII